MQCMYVIICMYAITCMYLHAHMQVPFHKDKFRETWKEISILRVPEMQNASCLHFGRHGADWLLLLSTGEISLSGDDSPPGMYIFLQSRCFKIKGKGQGQGWIFLNSWSMKRRHITNPFFSLVEIYEKLRKIANPPLAPYPSSKNTDSGENP